MRIAIVIPRATALKPTWTTVHLAVKALSLGHTLRLIEPWDFELSNERMLCRAWAFDHPVSAESMCRALNKRFAPRRFVNLDQIDQCWIRIAPLQLSWLSFVTLIKDYGVPVINDPDGLSRVAHKAFLAQIPGALTPKTIVTRSLASALLFYKDSPYGVVVKPAQGSGGHGVTKVDLGHRYQFENAFQRARGIHTNYVVVQHYLPAADAGEKRVIYLNGKAIGAYLRTRAPGEFRHNLKQGGQASHTVVTDEEHEAIASVAHKLTHLGIRVAGIDMIGGKIIEVNASNPGGAFHADRLGGTDLALEIVRGLTE